MYVYASELRKFCNFYILKLLFLSIYCRYIRYFVGTNDMLVGLHVPTNFQMYRQKSEKALLGGPPAPPPPPPLATLMVQCTFSLRWKSHIFAIWCGTWIYRGKYGMYVAVTECSWQPSSKCHREPITATWTP